MVSTMKLDKLVGTCRAPMVLGFASMLTAYIVWLTWDEGQDLPMSPAYKPAEVNTFMKQTGEKPFIYH
jgi:hypothetical protein